MTATREAEEELQVDAAFHPRFGSDPLLLSVTRTRGAGSHTDVTLWFVMHGRRSDPITADPRECNGVRWFPLQGTDWRRDDFDPQMHRFVSKLTTPPSHW